MKRTLVQIYYDKLAPDPIWRGRVGELIAVTHGQGPQNVLVRTSIGLVVVPRDAIRWGSKIRYMN